MCGLLSTDRTAAAQDSVDRGLSSSSPPKLPLLDPHVARELGIVAAHLLDEALGVLAPDKHLELDSERQVRRETVVDELRRQTPNSRNQGAVDGGADGHGCDVAMVGEFRGQHRDSTVCDAEAFPALLTHVTMRYSLYHWG